VSQKLWKWYRERETARGVCSHMKSCFFTIQSFTHSWGTWQHSWLRHYATSWKVTGSRPGSGGFFNWPNSSSCTMALALTQPLTEMCTRNLPGGKKQPARRADNLAAFYEPNVWKCGRLATLRASTACTGIALLLHFFAIHAFHSFIHSLQHSRLFSWKNWNVIWNEVYLWFCRKLFICRHQTQGFHWNNA
jgi:hypothetical protein